MAGWPRTLSQKEKRCDGQDIRNFLVGLGLGDADRMECHWLRGVPLYLEILVSQTMTCEVWIGPKQCGLPVPGDRLAKEGEPIVGYVTIRGHRVCLFHGEKWGRLYKEEK